MIIASTLARPGAPDIVDPYFIFSNRDASEVTQVSRSVQQVLGYDPDTLPGLSYMQFLCENDPLNEDVEDCQKEQLSDGGTIHALRSVIDADGNRRILSVYTVGVAEFAGGPEIRRHNIARDVTTNVQTHIRLMARLRTLEDSANRMTPQEQDIAEKVLEGKMNRDIAIELGVSDRTVERRRATIMKYWDTSTTSELVSKMVELNFLRTWAQTANDSHWLTARNLHVALAENAG